MSEALSSTEIEDVLSSIRRLVSEDLRPVSRPAPGPQPVVSNDKLILTPALRVVAEEGSDTPVFVPHPRHDHRTDAAGIEQVVASLGAAVGPQSTEWEAETGDSSPEFAEGPPADDWSLPEADGAASDAGLDATAMAPETFVFADAVAEVILAADPVPEQIPGWAQQDDSPAADEDPAEPAAAHGTVEPDPAWADAAEASVIASLSSQSSDADAEAALLPEDDALLFNEEVLRELVRDILREELAGKMGERITRNIRKLVRAEIARSFAAQEFD